MSEDLYENGSEGTDGSDADSDETLPPSDKETQPPLEECGQEVEWSQSPLGYFVSHGEDIVKIDITKYPKKICFIFEDKKWTFQIGAIGAVIKFNLRERSLLHCVQAAQAQCVVFSEEMASAFADISRDLLKSCNLYYMGSGQCPVVGAVSLDPLLEKSPTYTPTAPITKFTAQYIGEICRYLMAQPFRTTENQHRVRVMFGNGLQPGLWSDFQTRFGVKIIGEFYGATEGNCNVINIDNTIGACGFTSMIAPFMYPVTLIKVDEDNNIMRDRNGVCVRAKPGEPGELVGKIVAGDPLRQFDGYVNKEATDKKVAMNVFKKGDMAFLTGDVLIIDEYGYMTFRDRTGDTFRWRGANVSTFEVETTISKIIGLSDAVVYGVEVTGAEGRAGMAAIVDPEHKINLVQLCKALQEKLPPYSRPLFIRLMAKAADTTGTHKLKKTTLQTEGFNPHKTEDRLFYMNNRTGQYEPLTLDIYSDICKQKIRF
ncbi:long-chain fatty acid transport protein 1-like [Dreissena polymorpha]|uniref:long-chain fatty acid transport protein 1-like n=1 Tax=Dreissena polymorpha TaxID=45954 RepID=UPI002263EDEC|nr:long-chain fatty acid transport protein 1-like [Dreissena polymorpha]